MKKGFKYYLVVWLCVVSLFNMICFVTPETIMGQDKFANGFWPGYVFITVSFILHLLFAAYILREGGKSRQTVRIPLIMISVAEMIVLLLIGSLCMLLPGIAAWVKIILCYVILIISVLVLLLVKAAGEHTSLSNDVLNRKTSVCREMTARVERLKTGAGKESFGLEIGKVYEALRYSDPVSNSKTAAVEEKIQAIIEKLENMDIDQKNGDEAKGMVRELLQLVQERSSICKESKYNTAFCPECGAEVEREDAFCPKCGRKLK